MSQNKSKNRGPVDKEELETIFIKSLANATDLYDEACLLFEYEKLARSHFLFRVACEELGKCALVVSMFYDLKNDRADWKTFWNDFRNHEVKSISIEKLSDVLATHVYRQPFIDILEETKPVLEACRMSSLYTDYINAESNTFYEPREIISKEVTVTAKFLTERNLKAVQMIPIHDLMLLIFNE